MNWIKGVIAKLVAKQADQKLGLDNISKTKLSAIIFVILTGVTEISKAYGHPIVVPEYVYQALGGIGLWSVRDAIKS